MKRVARLLFVTVVCSLIPMTPAFAEKEIEIKPIKVQSPVVYTKLLQQGLNSLKDRNYHAAVSAFLEVLRATDEQAKFYLEAQYGIARALYFLKFYYASLSYFDKIVEKGPSHHRYLATIKWLLLLHKAIPGGSAAMERLAKYDSKSFPRDLSSELSALVGRYHYYQGELSKALAMLRRVNRDPKYFLDAKFLEGVIWARRYKARESLEAFKEMLRFLRRTKGSTKDAKKYEELALLSMARLFYSTQQFKTSIRYYDQIPIRSIHWLNALFESSYAYFRLGGRSNFEKAMGNLHTLSSPYFESEYFPEARIIQAVILYTNCHFAETLAVVDQLIRNYLGLVKSLQVALRKYTDPNDFYLYLSRLSRLRGAGFSVQLKRILNAALADRQLSRKFRFVIYLDSEVRRLEAEKGKFKDPNLVRDLLGQLNIYKELVIGETGRLARSRIERVVRELRTLIASGLKIKFETLNARKRMLLSKIRTKEYLERRSHKRSIYVSKEHVYWPFNGEYWKDELGYYIYQVESRCSR
ncbi:MAG: hypothetical protein KC609_26025 [Myxococcales bacterium]|nr:hypothetical protein [Myxococcales bacterium]